jgi:hypothetical protein
MLFFILVACNKVEPAPADIDGLSHFFWQQFDLDDDDQLNAGISNSVLAIDPDNLQEPLRGTISNLSPEELSLIGKEDQDPNAMSGIFFANIVHCSLEDIEKAVYATNQDERHDGYEEYNREYTSDLNAYQSREVNRLTWQTNYTVNYLNKPLSVEINGAIRHVTGSAESAEQESSILARGVLTDDAYLGDSETTGMFQDYQLEVYFPISQNESVHFFTIWREMVIGAGLDFSTEGMQDFVLDGMIEWDLDTEEGCQ